MCQARLPETVHEVHENWYVNLLYFEDEDILGFKSTDGRIQIGVNIGWENLGKGMTHGFVLEFESQEDLDYYLTEDPVHLEFSRNAAPLVIDSVVVGKACVL